MKRIRNWLQLAKYRRLGLALQRKVGKLGIHFSLYYWTRETASTSAPPAIRAAPGETYTFNALDASDLDQLEKKLPGYGFLQPDCPGTAQHGFVGLAYSAGGDSEIASFMSYDTIQVEWRDTTIHLQDGEAYLSNMYTLREHRGKNLAPYLRYHAYEWLARQGIDSCCSVTECLNGPSKAFKQKLGARHESLHCFLQLGGGRCRHWKLRDYR